MNPCCAGACAASSCAITNDPSTWPSGDAYWNVCQAIATAEGANVAESAPDRYNNPGDLSRGDEHGQPVSGYATLGCGEDEIIFASKQAGWNALRAKIVNAANGNSSSYTPAMTWQQFAQKYAGNSSAWLNNVCTQLGVSPTSTFGSYFRCA